MTDEQSASARRETRRIHVGEIDIGGGAPVSIQSMTTTRTADVRETVDQILALSTAGADIVRVTVNDDDAANGLFGIMWVFSSSLCPPPIIADIHFRHDLALKALEAGVQGLRLNPGNIKDPRKIREVAREAKAHGVPIRVGANAGSLHSAFFRRFGGPTPEALVASALWEVALFEEEDFHDIKISVKHSNPRVMIDAYRHLSEMTDHPLHLGVTEAGPLFEGTVKSAVGIGTLLAEGIGDTIRVSLAADPLHEVKAAKLILRSLDLRRDGIDIVACPTCGRVEGDVIAAVARVQEALDGIRTPIQVAIMGCLVNGPGEAREADIGLALSRHGGTLFSKGRRVREVSADDMVDALIEEVMELTGELNEGALARTAAPTSSRRRLPVLQLR